MAFIDPFREDVVYAKKAMWTRLVLLIEQRKWWVWRPCHVASMESVGLICDSAEQLESKDTYAAWNMQVSAVCAE